MAPNSLCRALIVTGSYAPGGENHHRLAHIKGDWRKGQIIANLIDPPDGIGPGGGSIPAWVLHFEEFSEQMYLPDGGGYNPKYQGQEQPLYDHWQALDALMGSDTVRHETRWWPEGAEPVVNAEMKVFNIYVPLKHYPYLANQDDPVHPADKMNPTKLWHEVRTGAKKYDSFEFEYWLSDAHPDHFDDLFGALPKGQDFITRLNSLVADCGLTSLDPADAFKDRHKLSLIQIPHCTLPPEDFQSLVIADLGQRISVLRHKGEDKFADALSAVTFRMTDEPPRYDITCDAGEALEICGDEMSGATTISDPWYWCLKEACYGMTRHNDLPLWMMRPWLDLPVDLEPIHAIWKAGGSYSIIDGVCHISRASY